MHPTVPVEPPPPEPDDDLVFDSGSDLVASSGESSASDTGSHALDVPVEAANWRLDQFLAQSLATPLPGLSRARIQELLTEGRITINGHSAKSSLRLRGGERILIVGNPERPEIVTRAEAIPLTVVYEDEWLAVVLKPAGMMVHAGAGASDEARSGGTLVNALLHRFPQLSALGGALRPGIVHRLDKETSGLLLIAKTDEAHHALVTLFAARQITKTYIALVEGHVTADAATIDLAIRRDSVRRTRMTTLPGEGARDAVTHFRAAERIDSRFGRFTLLRVRIETGRTHQIRVHMAAQRHPVVGDTLYGASGTLHAHARVGNVRARRETLPLDRHFLHAAELAFDHPFTGQRLELRAELTEDLAALLDTLGTPTA